MAAAAEARVALAFLVVGACSIIYYRANYGRTLASRRSRPLSLPRAALPRAAA